MMPTLLMALAGPTAAGLVFAVVVIIDRIREPHRDPGGVYAVVDSRTLACALRRVDRLEQRGEVSDLLRARTLLHAARAWLRGEIHTGRKRHRVRRAAQLEQVELRMEQLAGPVGLPFAELE
jgi:hypothetical protein